MVGLRSSWIYCGRYSLATFSKATKYEHWVIWFTVVLKEGSKGLIHTEFILEIAVICQEGWGCTSSLKRLSGLGRLALFLILCSVSAYNYFVNVSIAQWFWTQIIWYWFLLWRMLETSSPGTISCMEKRAHKSRRAPWRFLRQPGTIKNSNYDLFLVMSE